ncbi:MAG: FAD-dependent oxidoreductase [Acidobacteria bacterium]|nr:FAD-dependent oxidoreductase [Acidobacteriota bacterium]
MAATARVIILGGGLAGLAAAVRLAEAEYDVELLEKRSVLGGRASSFLPPGEAEPIDNCQHVLLGCCTNLLDFFRRVGNASQFRFYNRFLFLGPQGLSFISASALPAPLHLFPSLLRFRDLDWRDRWAIMRAMGAILRCREPLPDQPLLDWLRQRRQTPRAIEFFWRAVLVSALNEDLEQLSTRPAFQVFRESFLRNRSGYRMGVPTISLSDLYSSELLREKCELRLGTHVAELKISDQRIAAVRLLNGEESTADFYISALPPDALAALLPEGFASEWPRIAGLAALEWSPITGIHLWFDQPVTDLHHAAVLGRTIQWVFNKSALTGQSEPVAQSLGSSNSAAWNPSRAGYIQLVVSASRTLVPMRREEILELSLAELRQLFPLARQAKLLKAVVVKETKATLSIPPGADVLRPGPETPFRNLFLAGDWTATGWPPTMEGAVRSGYRAAEELTRAAGRPQQFLQPDLPTDPLVRFLSRR